MRNINSRIQKGAKKIVPKQNFESMNKHVNMNSNKSLSSIYSQKLKTQLLFLINANLNIVMH